MEKGTLIKVYNHNDETAVIVYRDENHQKKKIVKTDMIVDYYLLDGEGSSDIFIKQDKTKRFEAPYTKLVEDIVDNLNVINPVYKQKAEAHLRFLSLNFKDGYHRLKKNIFKIPGIYAADEPLENRAIEWFYDNYSEDLSYDPAKYTAFFDIETDVMWPDGKKRRPGAIDLVKTPDPVNIISLYYNDIIYVFAYNYGTKNPSFRDFITNFADKKEEIMKRIYERNNRPFTRKKKVLKGKEIKLEDIKLSLFTTEHEMIRAFFDKVHELDPDFLFAWNMSFDVRTLFGRLENTQADILKSEGERNISKWVVREYTKDFISDPKYSTDEYGKPFSPNYYYYISDEGAYTPAANRRDYAEICDGVNWLDQLIIHSILNVNNASDSDALEDVANEMYQIGKVQFPLGMDVFNVAWKDYELFFEYSIQDTMLLKKIEEELHNATEVFELSALYKCLPKDAFSQTKSTKSFMNYEAKKRGYLLRNNINAVNSYWKDPGNQADKDFSNKFGLNIREQLIREISGQNHELYNILMERDTHGGFVSETLLNTNKNGLVLYGNIKSNSIFGNAFDKDFSSLYPSTKHALSIDDDGAIARYAVYDRAIIEKQREMDYHKAYVWKSQPKKKDIQDHWLVTPDGSIEDQNLMIRIYDIRSWTL